MFDACAHYSQPTTPISYTHVYNTTKARDDSKRQKALERELEWMRMSPKARQTKSKARISSYEQMVQADEEAREVSLDGYLGCLFGLNRIGIYIAHTYILLMSFSFTHPVQTELALRPHQHLHPARAPARHQGRRG